MKGSGLKSGNASATARLIAAAQVMAWRKPALQNLVDPESAALCAKMLGTNSADRLLLAAAQTRLGRSVLHLLERIAAPGLARHWLHRKRVIERLVREGMAEGFLQLLVIGAGLDTLPLRLARRGELARVVCVDHPATQALVRVALPELADIPSLRLIAADLSEQDLATELHRANALEDLPTIVVAEGLLMYLTPEQVTTLLRRIAALPVPRVRAIVTAMDTPEGDPIALRPRRRVAQWWLKRRSEPMKSSIPAGQEAAALGAAGLKHIRTITAREFRPNRETEGIEGENIIVAERRER